jgi:hypothetical protein
MATASVNLKSIMDAHVKPVAAGVPGGNAAYTGLMALIGSKIDKDISLTVPDPPAVPSQAAASSPIDPTKALGDIAKAIRQAEQTLLGENLAIHNASVDVDLVVDVGGVAGASAKFNLQIGPVATD